jgi:integrase
MLSVTVLLANPRRRAPDHQPPGFRPIARRAADSAPRPPGRRRNPGLLAKAPTPDDEEIEPYDVAEIKQLLEAAAKRRNSARWAAALALGLRQGEALGLKREDVDLDGGVLRIRCSRLRPKYRHGCGGTCGQPTAGPCPKRLQTNNATKKTKSRAGRRTIGLPPPLIALLRKHLADQDAEREKARQLWSDEGWLFTTATGAPINPSTDYHEWKRLLKVAGLREARLHDARHTAATVLLILGQPERTVMSLMGWSSTNMTQRYQHVTDVVRAEVASQIGGLIWEARSDGSGEQTVLVRRDSLATILPYVEQGLGRVS